MGIDEHLPLKYRRDIRRMARFTNRVELGYDRYGNYHADLCWKWVGDYFYDHHLLKWYPVLPFAGKWVRADVLAFRIYHCKKSDGCLITGRVRPTNVVRRCGSITCVNPKHIEEVKRH